MAGMEQLEIHSKSYLVRWVNAKPNHTISWTVQPHKRSINFGLFKHPGHLSSFAHFPSVGGLPPLSLLTEQNDEPKDEAAPEVVEKLTSIGLKQVIRLGKCEADRYNQGKYEVPVGEAGNYALVFDNTFSKNTSKMVTIFLLAYPTSCQNQIQFGAQVHHSQAMASAMAMAPPLSSRKSPRMRAKTKESAETLRQIPLSQISTNPEVMPSENTTLTDTSASIHTGILQKRRRKKHQGYARRFFCLDFTSSTLSYYHDRNSSALRGAIPLSLAAIGANAKTREISIDSGTEVWHLKASNNDDFIQWKKALETASRNIAEATTPGDSINTQTNFFPSGQPTTVEDREWARLEELLSRIAGTRDSIRRLCLETLSKPVITPPQPSTGSTPGETGSEDYFNKNDERRPFWKRKASAPGTPTNNMFKRSASSSLAVPGSTSDPTVSNGGSSPSIPLSPRSHKRNHQHEDGMHDHMNALLKDLDKVVQDFTSVVQASKQRRIPPPSSAISRLSLQSFESQEYFDAEDPMNRLLSIPDNSDDETKTDEDVNSETSSDVDEGAAYLPSNRAMRSGSLTSLMPPKAKSLTPLPLEMVGRRDAIKAPTVMPPSLIGFLRKNVGKDLSTISMPVSANEPLSLLQRAAENLEYAPLLDTATKCSDASERLLYVTAFVISHLASSRVKERAIRKPFNPMLGETFELVREDLNFRFIAEKVSHRPVQLAYHAESTCWAYTQSPLPSQKFWGKSSEIITEGKARIVLHTPGECYSWNTPTSFLRNIIAGEKYVEPVGSMTIFNETANMKAVINFKAGGMFSGRSEDVDAKLLDETGAELPLGLVGTWTQNLCIKEHGKANTSRVIWSAGPLLPKAEKHYGMTAFAATLNEITAIEEGKMAPTDSRLRPDQRVLEDGNADAAEDLKNKLEEAQRARRREMESEGTEWKPRWFTPVENGDEVVWKLKTGSAGYWERRFKGDWSDVVEVLKTE